MKSKNQLFIELQNAYDEEWTSATECDQATNSKALKQAENKHAKAVKRYSRISKKCDSYVVGK